MTQDFSKNRVVDREPYKIELALAYVCFLVILVIGPPITWIADRVEDLLDKCFPDRSRRSPGKIP